MDSTSIAESSKVQTKRTSGDQSEKTTNAVNQVSELWKHVSEMVLRKSDGAAKNGSTSEQALHDLILVDGIKDPALRESAALAFSGAAAELIERSPQPNFEKTVSMYAAAQVSNITAAAQDKNVHIEQLKTDGYNALGNSAGLIASGLSSAGTDLLLEVSKISLPPALRILSTAAIGLTVGGLVNNNVAGRSSLASEGFISNGLCAGGFYAFGFVARGDVGQILSPLLMLGAYSAVMGHEKLSSASAFESAWNSALSLSDSFERSRTRAHGQSSLLTSEAALSASSQPTHVLEFAEHENHMGAKLVATPEDLKDFDAKAILALQHGYRFEQLFKNPASAKD